MKLQFALIAVDISMAFKEAPESWQMWRSSPSRVVTPMISIAVNFVDTPSRVEECVAVGLLVLEVFWLFYSDVALTVLDEV